MEFNEYQMAAERTARAVAGERERFINFVFGLTGEAVSRFFEGKLQVVNN